MIRSGDELGQTQLGNNNPYCQDNELSWLNWELDEEQILFLTFCQKMSAIRHAQAVLSRRNFFQGRRIRGAGVKDISWLTKDGNEIADSQWHSGLQALGMRLNGESIDEQDERGQPMIGDSLLVLLNSQHEEVSFRLPRHKPSERWIPTLDTSRNGVEALEWSYNDCYKLQPRSLVVFFLKTVGSPVIQLLHSAHASIPPETHVPGRFRK